MQKVKLQPYMIFRSKKDHDEYIAKVASEFVAQQMAPHRKDAFNKGIDVGVTYGIDMAILALGRIMNGIGIEHRCETCLCYNRSCVHNEPPGPCEEHSIHASWYPKPIDITKPDFWIEFMKQLTQASADYGELFDIDLEENHDDQYWWSGSKLDKELYEYISPDIYPGFEERYRRESIASVKNTAP